MISVIIPVYNAEQYLRECLESLIGQTFRDIEIIIVNDGSTDSSLSVARQCARNDKRIRLISQKNAGVSSARNRGIENAVGEYILFVDADDYLMDDRALEKIVANRGVADLVFFGIKFEHRSYSSGVEGGMYTGDALPSLYAKILMSEELNSPCSKLYSTGLLVSDEVRFNESVKIGEDLLFNIRYLERLVSVAYIHEPLYFYRTSNEASATRKPSANKFNDLMRVNDEVLVWAQSFGDTRLVGAAHYIRIKNIASCIRDSLQSRGNDKKGMDLIRYIQPNSIPPRLSFGVRVFALAVAYATVRRAILAIVKIQTIVGSLLRGGKNE